MLNDTKNINLLQKQTATRGCPYNFNQAAHKGLPLQSQS